jgi:hypothetical protein
MVHVHIRVVALMVLFLTYFYFLTKAFTLLSLREAPPAARSAPKSVSLYFYFNERLRRRTLSKSMNQNNHYQQSICFTASDRRNFYLIFMNKTSDIEEMQSKIKKFGSKFLCNKQYVNYAHRGMSGLTSCYQEMC